MYPRLKPATVLKASIVVLLGMGLAFSAGAQEETTDGGSNGSRGDLTASKAEKKRGEKVPDGMSRPVS
jgi:hypothetical protein